MHAHEQLQAIEPAVGLMASVIILQGCGRCMSLACHALLPVGNASLSSMLCDSHFLAAAEGLKV